MLTAIFEGIFRYNPILLEQRAEARPIADAGCIAIVERMNKAWLNSDAGSFIDDIIFDLGGRSSVEKSVGKEYFPFYRKEKDGYEWYRAVFLASDRPLMLRRFVRILLPNLRYRQLERNCEISLANGSQANPVFYEEATERLIKAINCFGTNPSYESTRMYRVHSARCRRIAG